MSELISNTVNVFTLRFKHFCCTFAMLSITLAGCATENVTPTPAPQSAPASAGVSRITSPFDPITLDPARASSVDEWWAAGALLFNQLYAYDAQGKLSPALAKDFPQVSGNGLTLTIPLREGVKFHNGRAMTADDVAFTLTRVLQPETASWGATWLMNIAGADEVANGKTAKLAGVNTLGPLALQIQLKQPQAAFPAMLALSTFSIVPRQETLIAGDDWGTRVVIGTGPFKLAEWKKGDHLRLERNIAFFQARQPSVSAIDVSFNVAAPVALDQWKKGEIDFALLHENAEEMQTVRDDVSLAAGLRNGESLAGSRIQFNPANRYTSDLRIRQAIASAIDPIAVFAMAQAEPANGLIPPETSQFDATFRNANVHDLDRAKKLLAAAGYPNGIDDLIIFSNEQPAEVQAIRDNLTAAGIRTRLVTGDPAQVRERIRAGEIAITYTTRRMDYNDAYAAFSDFARCNDNADSNAPFQWCNKQVQLMLDEAERLPLTSATRTTLYQKMQTIVVNQDVSQFIIGWRKAFGLVRAGSNPALHLIYGMPDVETLQGVQP